MAKAQRQSKKPAAKRAGTSDERVHLDLYKAIIDHRIAPGMPLQEDALAQAFDVSRTVIRKALQRLAHERLVELVPNKGAFVAKPSAEEARHVFEARHALERVLVERAIEAGSDRDIASLVETARQEKKAAEKGDKEERVKLSGAFHLQLARIGGNPVLTGFLTELVSRTSLIIALYESPGAVPCSHSEHLEIATAIRQRNRARAVQYMNHHLQHIEAQLDLSNALVNVDFAHLFKTSAPRRAAKAPT